MLSFGTLTKIIRATFKNRPESLLSVFVFTVGQRTISGRFDHMTDHVYFGRTKWSVENERGLCQRVPAAMALQLEKPSRASLCGKV